MGWIHKQEEFWDSYSQSLRCPLWGAEAGLSLHYTNNGQDCGKQLERLAGAADRCLNWLEAHQADIFAGIEADGLYDAAVEAVEDLADDEEYAELLEEDGVAWLLLDGVERIPLPYRKEDFFRSLFVEGLSFSADFKSSRFIADLFLGMAPNVFGDHSIEIFLKGDFAQDQPAYSVTVNGLAG